MIHKPDDLESVVWQLYDAGFRPNIKYGAGKLNWVSLTVNARTFADDRLGHLRFGGGA